MRKINEALIVLQVLLWIAGFFTDLGWYKYYPALILVAGQVPRLALGLFLSVILEGFRLRRSVWLWIWSGLVDLPAPARLQALARHRVNKSSSLLRRFARWYQLFFTRKAPGATERIVEGKHTKDKEIVQPGAILEGRRGGAESRTASTT